MVHSEDMARDVGSRSLESQLESVEKGQSTVLGAHSLGCGLEQNVEMKLEDRVPDKNHPQSFLLELVAVSKFLHQPRVSGVRIARSQDWYLS